MSESSHVTPAQEPAQEPAESSAPDTPPKTRHRRRPWLRLPLAILLQLVLLIIAVLIWLLATQSGLRFALGLADDFAPGLLQVERAEGRILGDLNLTGIKVRVPGLELDLGEAVLHWSPLSVLGGTLRIQELSARDVRLLTEPSDEPVEEVPQDHQIPLQLPDVALPIGIELEQVLVERVSIVQTGDSPPFEVDRASLSASMRGGRITLRELNVALPQPRLEAAAKGSAELVGDYPVDLSLTWSFTQEPGLTLQGVAGIGGDLQRLRIEHRLTGSAEVELDAVVQTVLEAPNWEATLTIERVDLPAIQADLPALDLQGRLTTSGDLNEARVQGKVSGEAPELPDFGHLVVDLDLVWRDLVLNIAALQLKEKKSAALFTVEGAVDLNNDVGRFDIRAAWEKLRWPLTGVLIAEARQGKLDASGTFDAYLYSVQADVWGRDFPEISLHLVGEGDQQSTQIKALELDTLEGKVSTTGDVSWAPQPSWDLALKADGIDTVGQWPDIPVKLALSLTSSGDLDAFRYDLKGQVDSAAVPSAKLALSGKGDIRGTEVETLRVDTLGGKIEAKAQAAWDPQVTWDATVDLADIDPGVQWVEWKGSLGGKLASTGRLTEEGPDLTAVIEGLAGKLRGYPVQADGKVAMTGSDIDIQEFLFASGPSQVSAGGTVGELLDLRFDLQSPDLRSLLPDATGSISAKGTVGGSLKAPAVKLDLGAKGVEVAGQGIERLSGKADLDLAGGGNMRIDLDGERLSAGGMLFDSFTIKGDGELAAHRLNASLQGEPLALELVATGGLGENNAYRGQIGSLSIRSQDFGTWRLQQKADVALAGEQLKAGPLCIRDQAGSGGCVGFEQSRAGDWTAKLDLDKLAFDLVKAFIPEGMILEGYLGGKADFKAEGDLLTGTADMRIPQGVVRTDTGQSIEMLNFSSSAIKLDAGASGLQARLNIPLAKLGGLNGDVTLPGWSLANPARPDQPLRGRIKASIDDLALVSRLVPDVSNVTGNIDVDLGVSGSIARPGVKGHARLASGGLEVPLIGLALSDLAFNAEAVSLERINYSGGFTAGDGRLEIKGHSLFGSAGLDTQIEVSGERLTLANSSEYFLLASPNIRVDAGPKGAVVDGEVTIPEARIRPRSIPAGTVSPSSDVVIGTEVQEQAAYALDLNLRLKLGKNVKVDAFGLTARLAGDLRVLQMPGKDLLGDGQLEVIDGSYRLSTVGSLTTAIGKPLTVEQGLIVFAKTPLSNPGLVLTAKREGGDVTAGVRVFGTIKNPKLTFFSDSDPGMTQSEVTNYLVTGIPPGGNKSGQGNSGLSVGTYVAPKLFMEYESALGDEQDKVKLRYEYNDWMEFQTETGESQGADVFFKFER